MNISTKLTNLEKRLRVVERKVNATQSISLTVYEVKPDGSRLYLVERGNGREWIPEDEFNAYRKQYMSEHGECLIIFTPKRMA